MIIYLCIKYESNKLIVLKDNERNQYSERKGTAVLLYAPILK